MAAFNNFHGACSREIHLATGQYVSRELSVHVDWRITVHMLEQRQRFQPSAVELASRKPSP